MKKPFIILPTTIIVLVITYLAHDLLKPMLTSPCESIFQQTSLSLGSKLEMIKTKGEVFIGKAKIQDLTERSQVTGLNLKTCCIVLETGKVSPEEFLSCKSAVERYEKHIETVVTYINEAQAAKQQGKTDLVTEKVSQMNAVLQVAETGSQEFHKQVSDISGFRPERRVEEEEPSKGGSEQEPNKTATIEAETLATSGIDPARQPFASPKRPEALGYVTGESPLQGERPWYEQLGTLEPPAQRRQR